MKIYQYSQIGTFHLNHNEDFIVDAALTENYHLLALMDGCSMGKESHFASCLFGKLIRKIAKDYYYQNFIKRENPSLDDLLKVVMKTLFKRLIEIQQTLHLATEELLCTLILAVVDHHKHEGKTITIGDGLIICNGKLYEYDQGDKPDYLAYHLDENFDTWNEGQKQRLSFSEVQDLALVSDGIFSFKPFDNQSYMELKEEALIDSLLLQIPAGKEGYYYKKEVLKIEKEFGLRPGDDFSIIHLVL